MTRASFWRAVLARLPLPMLALAASYGVYSFNRLFVPVWVALVSAAAFELTYVGLALLRADDALQRRRARAISLGAVAVSVTYNTLAGLAHRAPEAFADLPRGAEVTLALLHGAPLAIVAFLVADLLLHEDVHVQRASVAQLDACNAHSDAGVASLQHDARTRNTRRVACNTSPDACNTSNVACNTSNVACNAHPDVDVALLDACNAPGVAPVAPDVRERALAALEAGASVAEVAHMYGIKPTTLRSWRARAARRVSAAD